MTTSWLRQVLDEARESSLVLGLGSQVTGPRFIPGEAIKLAGPELAGAIADALRAAPPPGVRLLVDVQLVTVKRPELLRRGIASAILDVTANQPTAESVAAALRPHLPPGVFVKPTCPCGHPGCPTGPECFGGSDY